MSELKEIVARAIKANTGVHSQTLCDEWTEAVLRAIEQAGYAIVPKSAGQRLIDSAREQSRTYSQKAIANGDIRNLEEPRG